MKLHAFAMAGAAIVALSIPAAASDYQGWYIGLGAGWDTSELVHAYSQTTPGSSYKIPFHDDALGLVTIGYRWDNFRLELEGGYDQRGLVRSASAPEVEGGMSVTSGL